MISQWSCTMTKFEYLWFRKFVSLYILYKHTLVTIRMVVKLLLIQNNCIKIFRVVPKLNYKFEIMMALRFRSSIIHVIIFFSCEVMFL